eukprot:Skav206666  [mRNA]  locus=scaffold56:81536:83591:- [translate_table: standard]
MRPARGCGSPRRRCCSKARGEVQQLRLRQVAAAEHQTWEQREQVTVGKLGKLWLAGADYGRGTLMLFDGC